MNLEGESGGTIHLNVGGMRFSTLRMTLTAESDSMLAHKFAVVDNHQFQPPLLDDDGCVFIDRNPHVFPYVLDYLRNGCQLLHEPPDHLLTGLRADAEYFGLSGLVEACTKNLAAKKGSNNENKKHYLSIKKYEFSHGNSISDTVLERPVAVSSTSSGISAIVLSEREIEVDE